MARSPDAPKPNTRLVGVLLTRPKAALRLSRRLLLQVDRTRSILSGLSAYTGTRSTHRAVIQRRLTLELTCRVLSRDIAPRTSATSRAPGRAIHRCWLSGRHLGAANQGATCHIFDIRLDSPRSLGSAFPAGCSCRSHHVLTERTPRSRPSHKHWVKTGQCWTKTGHTGQTRWLTLGARHAARFKTTELSAKRDAASFTNVNIK